MQSSIIGRKQKTHILRIEVVLVYQFFYCCFNVGCQFNFFFLFFFIFDAIDWFSLNQTQASKWRTKKIKLNWHQFNSIWVNLIRLDVPVCQFIRSLVRSFRRKWIHLNQIPINKFEIFCVWYIASRYGSTRRYTLSLCTFSLSHCTTCVSIILLENLLFSNIFHFIVLSINFPSIHSNLMTSHINEIDQRIERKIND